MPKWWNWQTRMVQGHVFARTCGFKSHLRHHLEVQRDLKQASLKRCAFGTSKWEKSKGKIIMHEELREKFKQISEKFEELRGYL